MGTQTSDMRQKVGSLPHKGLEGGLLGLLIQRPTTSRVLASLKRGGRREEGQNKEEALFLGRKSVLEQRHWPLPSQTRTQTKLKPKPRTPTEPTTCNGRSHDWGMGVGTTPLRWPKTRKTLIFSEGRW